MDQFYQDLRYAVRTLVTRRAFSMIAIVTLALGIGITTAIFSVVYGILLRPLPFRDANRIVAVWTTDKKVPSAHGLMSHADFRDVADQAKSFESIALYRATTSTITGNGPASVAAIGNVTPGFFHVLGAAPLLGREFTVDEDRLNGPKVVVISYAFWKERLGANRDVVGTTIGIDGAPHRIVGVAPEKFDFPEKSRLWTPPQNDDKRCGRGCVYMTAVSRLAAGATVESARLELARIGTAIEKQNPTSNTGSTVTTTTLQHYIVGDVRNALLMLLGAVAMVLLIACANVANLLLVRGAARRSELAIRSAMGAAGGRIFAQLMTESLVLAAVSGATGIGLASWFVEALRSMAPASIPRTSDVGLDALTTLFALGLVFVTTLVFGLAPALQISRQSLGSSMREAGRGSDGSPRKFMRSAILVAEVALSVMLLLGAGLLLRSFAQLNRIDLGFDATNVTTFTISLSELRYPTADSRVQSFDRLEGKLRSLPGVESVGTVLGLPLGDIQWSSSFMRKDKPAPAAGDEPIATLIVADADYLKAMDIAVVRGRGFTRTDTHNATQVALISEANANKWFPGEDPLGKPIHVGVGFGYPNNDVVRTIVGIVKDVPGANLGDAPTPALYVPSAQSGARFASFVVRSKATTAQVLSDARSGVNGIDSDIALEYEGSLASLVNDELAAPRFYLALIGLFSASAALLAGVGIYGVVSFLVATRTREIGLRMALGAPRGRVVKLVMWQGLKPAMLGIGMGLTGGAASVRLMSSLLYGVAPHDILTYAAVTILLVALVLTACAAPAYRASRIAPIAALRAE